MDIDRINYILNNDEKFDIYYGNRPIWIQCFYESQNKAKIGFIDNFEEKDVYIEELYEKDLYNKNEED